MKRFILLLIACLIVAALRLPGAVSGQVDLVSRYIWRGFDLLPENHAAIQPFLAMDLGNSGLNISVWSSFALAKWEEYKGANEINLTLAYTFRTPEKWEVSAGFTHYGYWFAEDFTFKDNTSREIFASIARTDLPLSPQLSVYYDLNLGSGLYLSLGGSQELKLNEKMIIEIGGLIGFNSRQYIVRTGFSNIDLYAKVPLTLGKLTLTPALNVMIPLLTEVNEYTEIWFGFSVVL
jgi:hypothetical protein